MTINGIIDYDNIKYFLQIPTVIQGPSSFAKVQIIIYGSGYILLCIIYAFFYGESVGNAACNGRWQGTACAVSIGVINFNLIVPEKLTVIIKQVVTWVYKMTSLY